MPSVSTTLPRPRRGAPQPRHRSRGFSNADYLMQLGLIVAICVGVFTIYPNVQASSRALTTRSDLSTFAANLDRTKLLPTSLSVAEKAALLPKTWIYGDQVASVWGGSIAVRARPNRQIDVTLGGIPERECTKLLVEPLAGWSVTTLDGHPLPTTVTGEPNIDSISTRCAQGDAHTIAWTHKVAA